MRLFPRLADESDKAPKLDALTEQTGGMFVPAADAAICADCGGVFLYRSGSCPGCGSKQYVLLNPSKWVAQSMQDTQRRMR